MSEKPLITVVIPSYNHDGFISSAIESVFKQTYTNFELIIIDDGSDDDSRKIISEFASKYKFTYIFQENKGLSETLNSSLSLAKGEFITFCSSDDFLSHDKFEKQIALFNENKDAICVFSKAKVIDDLDTPLSSQTDHYNKGLSNDITFTDLLTFKVVLPVTCMYKLDMFKKVGGFDLLATAEDYDISLKIALVGQLLFIDEFLYFYRSPAAIGSTRKRKPMRLDVSESHLRTLNKYSEHPNYKDALIEWNYRRFILFSRYRENKMYALKGMLGSVCKFKRKMYLRSIVKLFIFWDK
ncbi:glycosyltransferase [Shewanella baltica]|uniref:glycosyltransferase n=1 Tax=Shewanella baltica TaxID=62322 RepID=UPI003D78EF93